MSPKKKEKKKRARIRTSLRIKVRIIHSVVYHLSHDLPLSLYEVAYLTMNLNIQVLPPRNARLALHPPKSKRAMRSPERKKLRPGMTKKRKKLRVRMMRNPRKRPRTAGLLPLRLKLRVIRFLRSRMCQRLRMKRRSEVMNLAKILYTYV